MGAFVCTLIYLSSGEHFVSARSVVKFKSLGSTRRLLYTPASRKRGYKYKAIKIYKILIIV